MGLCSVTGPIDRKERANNSDLVPCCTVDLINQTGFETSPVLSSSITVGYERPNNYPEPCANDTCSYITHPNVNLILFNHLALNVYLLNY